MWRQGARVAWRNGQGPDRACCPQTKVRPPAPRPRLTAHSDADNGLNHTKMPTPRLTHKAHAAPAPRGGPEGSGPRAASAADLALPATARK